MHHQVHYKLGSLAHLQATVACNYVGRHLWVWFWDSFSHTETGDTDRYITQFSLIYKDRIDLVPPLTKKTDSLEGKVIALDVLQVICFEHMLSINLL